MYVSLQSIGEECMSVYRVSESACQFTEYRRVHVSSQSIGEGMSVQRVSESACQFKECRRVHVSSKSVGECMSVQRVSERACHFQEYRTSAKYSLVGPVEDTEVGTKLWGQAAELQRTVTFLAATSLRI